MTQSVYIVQKIQCNGTHTHHVERAPQKHMQDSLKKYLIREVVFEKKGSSKIFVYEADLF